jgi:hypothetical protein
MLIMLLGTLKKQKEPDTDTIDNLIQNEESNPGSEVSESPNSSPEIEDENSIK